LALDQYYSLRTLAETFQTSTDFWRKRVASGEIKAVRLGRIIRIPEEEVLKVVIHLESIGDIVDKILLDKPDFTHL